MLYMTLFGLVQARPWFQSPVWISSVAIFPKYSVHLKLLAQLVIGEVVNEIVKIVIQPKWRPQVEVVHGLQGKWIINLSASVV